MGAADIHKLLEAVFQNSYFRFGSDVLQQTIGVAMGNRLAPPFSIVYMHQWETKACLHQPAFWVRYIDNIFGVWRNDLHQLNQFHQYLNQLSPTIQLSLEHTGQATPSIPFLNTSVSIAPDGFIQTELFIKPTHSGVLLHYMSAHPETIKRAVACMQAIREQLWWRTPRKGK